MEEGEDQEGEGEGEEGEARGCCCHGQAMAGRPAGPAVATQHVAARPCAASCMCM